MTGTNNENAERQETQFQGAVDENMIPTRELQKLVRQRDYALAKAQRRADKRTDKDKAERDRIDRRVLLEQTLWKGIKPASLLDKEPVDGAANAGID